MLLTAALTWPQILQPAAILEHRDSWFNLWRLAWIAHQLPRDPAHLFDANIFFPERNTLAYSDAVILQGVLGAPLHWIGLSPPVVGTTLVLGSFVFAGMAAYALVCHLTGSAAAGFLSGVVFAFTPYRFDHYMHLEMLWSGWMPLVLLALHCALEGRGRAAGVVAGLLFAAQVLSCIYYGVFFVPVLLAIVVVLATGIPASVLKRAAPPLVLGAAVASLLVLPYFVPYRLARETVGPREAIERQFFSAGPRHYLSATPGNRVYGSLTGGMGRHEKRLFPGAVALTLMAVALWPPYDRRRLAYLAGLLLAMDLSFGPRGISSLLTSHLFVFEGLRAPARAGQIALLMVAILAGDGLARLSYWFRSAAASRLAVSVLTVLALAEYVNVPLPLVPAPTAPSALHHWLARQPSAAVAQFPMPEMDVGLPLHDDEFTYQSVFHWRRLANGYSGSFPASYVNLLVDVRPFPSPEALDALSRAGLTHLTVHERFYGPARYREITAALSSRPDLTRFGPFPDGEFEVSAYRFTGPDGRP